MEQRKVAGVLMLTLFILMTCACVGCDVEAFMSSSAHASPPPGSAIALFPMSPAEFANRYHVTLDWEPSEILDYADEYSKVTGSADGNIKWQLVSADGYAVEVNEVEWVTDNNEPNGFRIDDASAETKRYELASDAGVWLLIESSPLYQIPLSDLPAFLKSEAGRSALWNFKLEDGKVALLTQQYLP